MATPGDITTSKYDANNDGIIDDVTTTVISSDVNNDGVVDFVETVVVAKNDDSVVFTSSNIDAAVVDTDMSSAISLVPARDEAKEILKDIELLKSKISCGKLQHLGSMSDYAELFQKAKQYIDEVGDTNIELILDTKEIENFAIEAKKYAEVFAEIELKFSRMSTINETAVLNKIKAALTDISLMYETVQKFKATITSSSVLQIPDSIKDVSETLINVSESIKCSLPYIEYFADSNTVLSEAQLENAKMSDVDKAALTAAARSLELWIDMIKNEANVAMTGNEYVKSLKAKIAGFFDFTERLASSTAKITEKLAAWRSGIY